MYEKMKHKNKPKKVDLQVSSCDEKCKGGDLSFYKILSFKMQVFTIKLEKTKEIAIAKTIILFCFSGLDDLNTCIQSCKIAKYSADYDNGETSASERIFLRRNFLSDILSQLSGILLSVSKRFIARRFFYLDGKFYSD